VCPRYGITHDYMAHMYLKDPIPIACLNRKLKLNGKK